jgi:hypothetical protein
MLTAQTLPEPSKIDWNRAVEWSSGEEARRAEFEYVTACSEWKSHTGDATVAVDNITGRILGCEDEDYPHIRNITLIGELGINSIGEVWIKTETANIDIDGTIDVSDDPSPEEISRRHLQQLVDGGLSATHSHLVQKVWAAQEDNTSRSRLAYFGGRPVVETEFTAFVDQNEIWSKIEAAAAEIGAVVDIIDTRPRIEHYSPGPNGSPAPGSRPDPDNPGWYFGADHGRPEKEVAVQISLTDDFTSEQIGYAHKLLASATDEVWPLAGIAIL